MDRLRKIKEARIQFYLKSQAKESILKNNNQHSKTIFNSPTKSQSRKNTNQNPEIERRGFKKNKERVAKIFENLTTLNFSNLHTKSSKVILLKTVSNKNLNCNKSIDFDESLYEITSKADDLVTKLKDNENNIKTIKLIQKNFIQISKKLDYEKTLHSSNSPKQKKNIICGFNFSTDKELNSTEKIDNNIGFADEFKIISEFTKTPKAKFDSFLYQKVASDYCKERKSSKTEKKVNVVDCLALDNLNRIYNSVYLPTIKKSSISVKKTKLKENDIKEKHNKSRNFFRVNKGMTFKKLEKSSMLNLNTSRKLSEYYI